MGGCGWGWGLKAVPQCHQQRADPDAQGELPLSLKGNKAVGSAAVKG